MSSSWQPMPLIRIQQPFDHPDWLFELKLDGYRTLALVEAGRCTLVSRRGNAFTRWTKLADEVARTLRARSAVLDGELCVLRPDGHSEFGALFAGREVPHLLAFDLLVVEGEDIRDVPLHERKERLRGLVPRDPGSRLRYVDHVESRGTELFGLACEHDLEGIVAKWRIGSYHTDGKTTSWVKLKNPAYSQLEGRFEHLAKGRGGPTRSSRKPYRLDPALAPEAPRVVHF